MINKYINAVYHGDCLSFMEKLPDKCIDLVLTDPPYNAKNIGPNKRVYENQIMKLPDDEYKKFCENWFELAIKKCNILCFTPGIANTHNYPQPDWQICWHKPASTSFNRFGGFNAWEPIFLYKNIKIKTRLKQDYILENTLNFKKGPEKDHPCPKPYGLMSKLIKMLTFENDIIFDPFAGSGTTAGACIKTGRKYILCEKEKKYVDICHKRIAQAKDSISLLETIND